METLTTLEIVKNKVTELQPMYDRMDKTRKLVYLTPYQLMQFDGTTPVDKVINVTTNWPAIFANAIISDLIGAVWQTVIESDGKLTDKQKHQIETFIEDNLAQVDEQLGRRGQADLFTWLCNHVCIRSLIGARWVSQFVDGKYAIDCLPVDMRWTPFEYGKDGLNWVAPKTFRSRARIQAQYEKELKEAGVDYSGLGSGAASDLEVVDFWGCEKKELWIEDKLIKKQKNPFGYPPFVIEIPSAGFMLRDKGYIEHEGEDLFFLNRGLYDERSRQMTIEQTLGMDVLYPPYEQEADEAGKGDKPPKTGETLKVKTGERHQLLPRGDLTNAFRTGRADVQRDLQMGGVNDIDLGNVSQTVSAVWITEQSEIRNKLILPRIKSLNGFRQQLGRMMIDQYRQISGKGKKTPSEILVGVEGRRRKYSVSVLGDPATYTITNRLMSKSKKQEIVNLAMFEAARDDLPLKVRLTDILMADDPDEIMRQLDIEKAKRDDPAIGLFEMAIRYAEEAEDLSGTDADRRKIQSMMLTERGCALIRQRTQMPEEAAAPPAETRGPGMKEILPLLGRGTPGGGRRSVPVEEE